MSGVLLNAIAQLALKAATRATGPLQVRSDTLASTAIALAGQPWLWLGLACYGISVAMWLVALSRAEVSVAYPMLSLGYIVTAMAAWVLFNEALSMQRIAAIAIIICGVWLLARS